MKKIIFSFFCLVFLFGGSFKVAAQDVAIDFFYSATCPHCADEKKFLEEDLKVRYPEVTINYYEVMSSAENQELLRQYYEDYKVPEREWGLVPVTFTPTKYFVGWSENIKDEMENCLVECMGGDGTEQKNAIDVPFFGTIDISQMSLPVMTVVIAALDGFNPCAMWILVFLLTLLINSRSRKRMLLIGGTFVFVSGHILC
jgi:glutaredoxin